MAIKVCGMPKPTHQVTMRLLEILEQHFYEVSHHNFYQTPTTIKRVLGEAVNSRWLSKRPFKLSSYVFNNQILKGWFEQPRVVRLDHPTYSIPLNPFISNADGHGFIITFCPSVFKLSKTIQIEKAH